MSEYRIAFIVYAGDSILMSTSGRTAMAGYVTFRHSLSNRRKLGAALGGVFCVCFSDFSGEKAAARSLEEHTNPLISKII